MKTYTDQMNSTIRLESAPRRIVSLVPSQTDLFHHLGLEDEVVGITKFCISPNEWFRSKTRVGGTKSIDIEKVKTLKPDLIIGNKEENSIDDIKVLEEVAPVWMSDIYTLEDAIEMIRLLSDIMKVSDKAESLIKDIDAGFKKLNNLTSEGSTKSVLYYIWKDPGMVSGKNTFVDDMLSKCGLVNASNIERYPVIEELEDDPDLIFLSSEPFPFKEIHMGEFQTKFPKSKIVLVDGEMFSWYGSKLKDAPFYFSKLIGDLRH